MSRTARRMALVQERALCFARVSDRMEIVMPNRRLLHLALTAVLAALVGCPLPPELVTCEEVNACETTEPAATTGDETPTTGEGVNTVTGDSADARSTSEVSPSTTNPRSSASAGDAGSHADGRTSPAPTSPLNLAAA